MDSHFLTALQALMTDRVAADLDPSHLKRFYTYCARRPLVLDGKPLSLPFKTLLLNHTHLRPEVKIALDEVLREQWHRFTAETSQTSPPVVEDRPASELLPASGLPPADDRPESWPVKEDGFDRFLNGVRRLLFL
jgi:hypothetical protein